MPPLKDLLSKPLETLSNPSGTTTLPSKPLAPISQQTGARGSQTTSITTAPDLGRAITQADPQETYRALQARMPPAIRSALKPVYRGEMITKYELTGTHGAQESTVARTALVQSLTPISGNEALDLLTELKGLTRPSQGTTADLEAQFVAYLKRLVEWPADVVRYVITTQPNHSSWWPAWQELRDRLEMHTYRRRMMLEAIQTASTSPVSSSARPNVVDGKIANETAALMQKAEEILADRRRRKAASNAAAEISPEQAERDLAEAKTKYSDLTILGAG